MTLEEFLRDIPPTKSEIVEFSGIEYVDRIFQIQLRDTLMYCENCEGERFFNGNTIKSISGKTLQNLYIHYICKNCNAYIKMYAVSIKIHSNSEGEIYKYGEFPPFGPPTPSKLINLIGPDRELFLVGRRAENQDMGIGAFTYYRRVLENQKNRIIDEMIKVLKKYDTEESIINKFEKAKDETQFSNAIETIKDVLPKILLIDNHNPLSLIHTALSNGIHAQTDEECLELATSIRVLLIELADRMNGVLKEKKDLKEAVSKLLKPKK